VCSKKGKGLISRGKEKQYSDDGEPDWTFDSRQCEVYIPGLAYVLFVRCPR